MTMNYPYQNPELSHEVRAKDLVSRMSLEEKAAQSCMMRGVEYATKPSRIQHCSVEPDTEYEYERLLEDFGEDGIGFIHDIYSTPEALNRIQKHFVEHSRWGIPAIFTGEALHGLSGTRGTVFPCPINWGATFDTDLVHRIGEAIGRETRSLGIQEILAPNLDVAREPRWGRIEETFGEDTCLSAEMAKALITGEQKGDISRPDSVAAEPKHFCVHGIPEGGTNCSPARAGKREIESCYLPVFEAGIAGAGAKNVMVSYNSIDGVPMMCNEEYLKDILKERMGLTGYTRSDWGGVGRLKTEHFLVSTDEDAIALAVNNGLDVQGCDYSPQFWKETVIRLVKQGRISEARLDDIVTRVLQVKFEMGLFEHPYTDENAYQEIVRCEAHQALAYEAAVKSLVLLKNEGGLLPLSPETSIALIGPSSARQKIGGYSSIPQFHVPSLYETLKEALTPGGELHQCDGCVITYDNNGPRIVEGQPHLYSEGEEEQFDDFETALQMAGNCDVIVFVGGDNTVTSGEGRDRCELTLSGRQRELIEKLAGTGKPVVLVLENGKPLEISRESEICDSILMTFFGGEAGAQAICDALLGKVSPAGRLPLSLPRSASRIPCYYSMLPGGAPEFMEGPKSALYGFGSGLTYTHFEYSDGRVVVTGPASAEVSCTVTNTGTMASDEVVQLYIEDVDSSVATPPMLLKAFRRIHLEAGASQEVRFTLDQEAFKLMDPKYRWVVEPGLFRIRIGSGSRDLRLELEIQLEGCVL